MAVLALLVSMLAPQDPAWTVTAASDAIGSTARVELQSPDESFRLSVGAFLRLSWPLGSVDDHDALLAGNVVIVPDHIRYNDLFDPGAGIGLEASLMLFHPESRERGSPAGPSAGLYVSLQVDTFEGSPVSDGTAFIEPGDLDMATAFIGIVVATDLGGGGYGQAHLGAGLVRYDSVSANVSLNAGGSESQELFEESREFASEFRYRFNVRLGPLALAAGLGVRLMSGPDEGESAMGDLLETNAFWTFDADLGLELGF